MATESELRYAPDYAVPPGDTLLEIIESLGISQAELSSRTGRPTKTINEIIKGKASITPETALQLERVLGVPASFWNSRERTYQEVLARIQEQKRLRRHLDWLKQLPVRSMVKAGWIQGFADKVQQLQEVLGFFGVASPAQWRLRWGYAQADFRKSRAFTSNPGARAAWLRRGEIESQKITCAPYNANGFRRSLASVRQLTAEPPEVFQPRLVQLSAEHGVAVVFVPELPKTHVNGATKWLSPSKALIQLSLRYKTDDHLWFTFFHEAGHIVLHGKRITFLETGREIGDKESEADTFAMQVLIPPSELQMFLHAGVLTRPAIRQFARKIGVAPGIIVGRLQHDGVLPHSHFNDLKQRFRWAN